MIDRPVQTIDSGPALAPIAGLAVQNEEPQEVGKDLIVVDTGGTSFDAGLVIDGNVAITREKWFGPKWYGHMTGLPAVDTRSIGSGGGSIAYVDGGGLLRVGPQSAGADPGPVAYGRGGTEPTVTDAAVVLGYLDPDNFLDGRMTLDRTAAKRAIESRIAEPLGASAEAAADAILTIASEEMRGLLMDLTITQGRDIRNCLIVAGGGAAGINICRIAREAEIATVLMPRLAAGLCAVGGLHSDIMAVFSKAFHAISSDFDFAGVNGALAELGEEMAEFEQNVKVSGDRSRRFLCEARYEQEMWEIDVALGDDGQFGSAQDLAAFQTQFDANHLDLFATEQPGAPIEIITWRGEMRIARKKPNLALRQSNAQASTDAISTFAEPAVKPAWFSGEKHDTPVYRAADIPTGSTIEGPAIITEPTTTIVIDPGARVLTHPAHYTIKVA
jgi:N-methylhydantoinase A